MTAATTLAIAVAVALGPYPALVALGLAAHFGWLQPPATLSGLASPTVWATLLALWAIEIAATRHPLSDLLWNAFHTIVRPVSAALAAGALLSGSDPWIQWLGSLGGLALGCVIHMQRFGLHVIASAPDRRPRTGTLTATAGALGAGLALLALHDPGLAASVAILALLLPLPWAPILWRAAARAVRRWWPGTARGTGA